MLYIDYLKNKKVYQEQGTQLLLTEKHACLFYKPGKGKTYPTVEAIREIYKMKGQNCKVLVLSTKDAITNMWEKEIASQNILPSYTVFMTFNGAIVENTKCKLLSIPWTVIVVDESHKIKSHNSKISKLVYQLTKKCEYAFGLTGTPRGNNDIDIFCQLHNLNVSDWGKISYTQFVTTCCSVEQMYFSGRIINQPKGIKQEYKAGWEKNLSRFTQRMDYEEEDDMPGICAVIVDIPFEKSKIYKDCENGFIQIQDYETTMTKLTAINKMHQAANGYIYTDNNGKRVTHRFQENKKLKWLKENSPKTPFILVYQFTEDFEDLSKLYEGNYTEDIDEFQKGNINVLLLQCSRCESFNLQMCQRIIFYTMDYSYIKYDQMIHRVWRMGQMNDVLITILLFKNSVEEQIWNAVQNKQKASDLFMSIKGELA